MSNLWDGYRETVLDTFPDMVFESNHTTWKNKRGVNLTADTYSGKHFIKSRHVDIWDGKNLNIHNIYFDHIWNFSYKVGRNELSSFLYRVFLRSCLFIFRIFSFDRFICFDLYQERSFEIC